MNPLPLIFQAYTPQIQLGDWQIVITVYRKRNVIAVERWHSSEQPYERQEIRDQSLRIETGIRAFRQQMPVLANALESAAIDGLAEDDIIESVFKVLADIYAPEPETTGTDDFTEFLEERKREARAVLSAVRH
jgi:hypothetical protein